MEIRAVIGAGLSASAFSNSVSVLITVLGLSGHCNSCRANGAVICNSRGCHIVGQSYSCNSCVAGSAIRAVIVRPAARGPVTQRASLSSRQALTIVALAECMWLNCKRGLTVNVAIGVTARVAAGAAVRADARVAVGVTVRADARAAAGVTARADAKAAVGVAAKNK